MSSVHCTRNFVRMRWAAVRNPICDFVFDLFDGKSHLESLFFKTIFRSLFKIPGQRRCGKNIGPWIVTGKIIFTKDKRVETMSNE